MILLNEITYRDDGSKQESKILINPYLIVSIRQPGIYTLVSTLDGQEIKVVEHVGLIVKKLDDYDLTLVNYEVLKKDLK